MSDTCNFEWRGPRHDVPTSAFVAHVCCRDKDHIEDHLCSCGAPTLHDDAIIEISEEQHEVLNRFIKGELTLDELKEMTDLFIVGPENTLGVRVRVADRGGPLGKAGDN